MKLSLISAFVLGLALAASAQDAPILQPQNQTPGLGTGPGTGVMASQFGSRGGSALIGTVTEVASSHYTIKTDMGETYTVFYSVNTRIIRQAIQRHSPGGAAGGNPPQILQPSDIKIGDAIGVMGEVDATAKSVGAVVIAQLDPVRAMQLREQRVNYGKTWLMGKVTAVDGVKVTVMGSLDNATHSFVADENTTFRKRREPITLADVQVGDNVRVEGAIKDGGILATTVVVMGMPPGGTLRVPREVSPAPQP
jgi:hypothetical protein